MEGFQGGEKISVDQVLFGAGVTIEADSDGEEVVCNVLQVEGDVCAESLYAAFEREGLAERKLNEAGGRSAKRRRLEAGVPYMEGRSAQMAGVVTVPSKHPISKKSRQNKAKAEARWRSTGHLPRPAVKRKHIHNAPAINTALRINKVPVKRGGYNVRAETASDSKRQYSLSELMSLGMTLVPYKGCDTPIQDKRGRILSVLAAPPKNHEYDESCSRAWKAMRDGGAAQDIPLKDLQHKRGKGFLALNVGLSYGIGHTKPTHPDLKRYESLGTALLENPDIQRLASYQDAAYAMWHPNAYMYYKTELDKLHARHPELTPNFRRSILPTVAFNIGSNVWTFKHVDSQNCPFGWCCVTALGSYDYKKGGHIILWDFGLVIEFPPGAVVCLPSALITHSNIPVAEGEYRCSFTQYCPGEIFRYVENDFSTDAALKTTDSAKLQANTHAREHRARRGFEMFSTLSSLRSSGFTFTSGSLLE